MGIIVNPQTKKEKALLLAFLDKLNYDYQLEDEGDIILSPEQQELLLERDKVYESGEMKSYSLEEIMDYFKIKK